MARRNDKRTLQRRGPRRHPRKQVLVVCEGARTEPEYLDGLRRHYRNAQVALRTIDGRQQPYRVVQTAIRESTKAQEQARREHDDNLAFDVVWCVFDVDEHPLDEAIALARDNGIFLAISNPSIELWLLLHFQDQRAHLTRDKARRDLQKHLPGYDKGIAFERYRDGYDAARDRARDLNDGSVPGPNPSTGIWRLTELVRTGQPVGG